MPLTDVAVRNAKPRDKAYKLAESGGLYLYVAPTGGRLWRMDYRHESKRQTLSIGRYPITGLSDARTKRDGAKSQLAAGVNPAQARKEQKEKARASEVDTFEAIAREWYALQKSTWVPRHAEDVIHSLERDVFPTVGDVPIREITAPQVLKLLRSVEGRPAIETEVRATDGLSADSVEALQAAPRYRCGVSYPKPGYVTSAPTRSDAVNAARSVGVTGKNGKVVFARIAMQGAASPRQNRLERSKTEFGFPFAEFGHEPNQPS